MEQSVERVDKDIWNDSRLGLILSCNTDNHSGYSFMFFFSMHLYFYTNSIFIVKNEVPVVVALINYKVYLPPFLISYVLLPTFLCIYHCTVLFLTQWGWYTVSVYTRISRQRLKSWCSDLRAECCP